MIALGFFILIGILLLIGVVAVIVRLLHFIFKSEVHHIGEFGTVIEQHGKKTLYPPMSAGDTEDE